MLYCLYKIFNPVSYTHLIAVYFGSAGIRRTRYAIPAALAADLAGFMAAAFAERLFFGVS